MIILSYNGYTAVRLAEICFEFSMVKPVVLLQGRPCAKGPDK